MRPITRPAQQANVPSQDPLGQDAHSLINKEFEGSISVEDALNGLWDAFIWDEFDLSSEEKPDRYDSFSDRAVRNSFTTELEGRYQEAGPVLTGGLGMYCVYCGITLHGYHVEHEVPKVPYVKYLIDWSNLLVACVSCNTVKGNRPTFDAIYALLPYEADYEDPDTYRSYLRENYLFPDVQPAAYRAAIPDLRDLAGNPLPDCRFNTNFEIELEIPSLRCVEATFSTSTGPTTVQTRVDVVPEGEVPARTVELIGLNKVDDEKKSSDFRVYYRTIAWYRALKLLKKLKLAKSKQQFDDVWGDTLQTAKDLGFYSVWVTVLSSAGLGRKFVSESLTEFPGTNVNAMLNSNHLPPDTFKIPGTDDSPSA